MNHRIALQVFERRGVECVNRWQTP